MSTYSEISDDYLMFETKMPVDYHDSIENYVSTEDMFRYMFNILLEYDRCMTDKRDAKINPMSGRVSMRLENGLEFQIPEEIQKIAISKFVEMKNNAKDNNNHQALQEQLLNSQKGNGKSNKANTNFLSGLISRSNAIILAVVIFVVILYLVYQYYNQAPRFDDLF